MSSPSVSTEVLLAALLLVGLTAVGAQLLIPLASDLADPDERGRVVGTVASGALVGISGVPDERVTKVSDLTAELPSSQPIPVFG